MARRIVIIQGHPDGDAHRLCRALADAYATGAEQAGHGVSRIDIATLDFPLLRNQVEFETGDVPDSLLPAVAALRGADHVVLVFPLWLGTVPALTKAFLEQVFRPHIAFEYQDKAPPKLLLTGRSARLVVTMGMPALVYRWWFMAHGIRGVERNILGFVGIKPVRRTLLGLVTEASPAKRQGWLRHMRELGAKAR